MRADKDVDLTVDRRGYRAWEDVAPAFAKGIGTNQNCVTNVLVMIPTPFLVHIVNSGIKGFYVFGPLLQAPSPMEASLVAAFLISQRRNALPAFVRPQRSVVGRSRALPSLSMPGCLRSSQRSQLPFSIYLKAKRGQPSRMHSLRPPEQARKSALTSSLMTCGRLIS